MSKRRPLVPLVVAGLLIEASIGGMVLVRSLRQHTIPFLGLYGLAYLGYAAAVWLSLRERDHRLPGVVLWGLAILFRVTLLLITPPTLSDDVYRYLWDGRLLNAGMNPYAYPVASPFLDRFDSPLRAQVNHNWMASPYLPVAQAFFAAVYRLAPQSPLAFQIAAVCADLLTGLLLADLLRRLRLPAGYGMIYLWNPLIIVEFAHGAHVDALMILLIMLSLWLLIAFRARLLSVIALAAATLTKGVPLLLLPALQRRWGWGRTFVYIGLVAAACLAFALGAGWGLTGPLDGTGVFGALRIYGSLWNYNGGLYHWLEALLTGFRGQGAASPEGAGWQGIWAAKLLVGGGLLAVLAAIWWAGRKRDDDLVLLRRALLALTAYLLLTTTVHPWYVTLVIPLLPFLLGDRDRGMGWLFLAGGYFAAVVPLSYLTYLDPANLREYEVVRILEYVPLYFLLLAAAWSASADVEQPGRGLRWLRSQIRRRT